MPRTELEVLLNEPVTVVIGTKDNPIKVEIREPVNAEVGEYMALIGAALSSFLNDNSPLIRAVIKGEVSESTPFSDASIAPLLDLITAKIIMDGTGEPCDVEWVQKNVAPKQQAAIIRTFADQIGWEFIRETFLQATRKLMVTATKNENDAAPSWSNAPSAKSSAHSPN